MSMKQLAFAVLITAAMLTPIARAQHISVGVIGGVPFTGGISDFTSTTIHTFSNSNEYLIGPMVEVHLPLSLSIEGDALYRPVNVTTDFQGASGTVRTSTNYSTWEFPVLGKFRLPIPVVKPFIEAGPSFRATSSSLSFLSNHGFTVGGGIELKILRMRLAPVFRYTHWAEGSQTTSIIFNPGASTPAAVIQGDASRQSQAEFLVSLSF